MAPWPTPRGSNAGHGGAATPRPPARPLGLDGAPRRPAQPSPRPIAPPRSRASRDGAAPATPLPARRARSACVSMSPCDTGSASTTAPQSETSSPRSNRPVPPPPPNSQRQRVDWFVPFIAVRVAVRLLPCSAYLSALSLRFLGAWYFCARVQPAEDLTENACGVRVSFVSRRETSQDHFVASRRPREPASLSMKPLAPRARVCDSTWLEMQKAADGGEKNLEFSFGRGLDCLEDGDVVGRRSSLGFYN